MIHRYTPNAHFRKRILKLLTNTSWLSSYGQEIIKPEYFDDDLEQEFTKACLDFYKKYSVSPKKDELCVLLKNKADDFVQDVFSQETSEFVIDTVIQFAREEAAKLAVLDCSYDIENGDLSKLPDKIEKALEVGRNLKERYYIDPYKDIDQWLYNYWEEKIGTGMSHMDQMLEGGLGRGEMGIIMAPPGRGKTMALINLAYGAARVGNGKKVVFFSHEMTAEKLSRRFAARVMFRFAKAEDDLQEYEKSLYAKARKLITGQVRIVYGTGISVHWVESQMKRLEGEGFVPDLIIDDYPDKVKPPGTHYSEDRNGLTAIYQWFRDFAGKHNAGLWVGSQVTRASYGKDTITLADIAEDINKVNIADAVYSLNQSIAEKQNGQARFYPCKIRDASNQFDTIVCKYYGGSQALISHSLLSDRAEEEV